MRLRTRLPLLTLLTYWDDCRETSESKARTHSHDFLVNLLIDFAMDRENHSHIDKYLRKHLRRGNPCGGESCREVTSSPSSRALGPCPRTE